MVQSITSRRKLERMLNLQRHENRLNAVAQGELLLMICLIVDISDKCDITPFDLKDFKEDLLDLALIRTVQQKLSIIEKLYRTFSFLK